MTNPFVPLVDLPPLPDGYAARPPARDDAPALAQLLHDHEAEITGSSDMTLADFLGDWEGIDLETDAVVIAAPDGAPAAYADVGNRGDVQFSIYGYVHPAQRGRGLGTYLVAWGEHRAKRGAEANAAPGAMVLTRHYINEKAAPATALLTALGYAPARATYTMAIDMTAPPPDPVWPDGLSVRNVVPGQDDEIAYEAYEEAFADTFQRPRGSLEDFRSKLRRPYFDPRHWFLVMDGDQVAGTLFSDAIDGNGWVEIVGVRRPWRGRGVALAMLLHAFGVFYERGVTHVGLSVDAHSPTGAPRVYQRAGMHLDQTLLLFERHLRPGFAPGSRPEED